MKIIVLMVLLKEELVLFLKCCSSKRILLLRTKRVWKSVFKNDIFFVERDGSVRMNYLFFVGVFVYILTIKNYEYENDKKKSDMYFGDNHSIFPYFYVYKIS